MSQHQQEEKMLVLEEEMLQETYENYDQQQHQNRATSMITSYPSQEYDNQQYQQLTSSATFQHQQQESYFQEQPSTQNLVNKYHENENQPKELVNCYNNNNNNQRQQQQQFLNNNQPQMVTNRNQNVGETTQFRNRVASFTSMPNRPAIASRTLEISNSKMSDLDTELPQPSRFSARSTSFSCSLASNSHRQQQKRDCQIASSYLPQMSPTNASYMPNDENYASINIADYQQNNSHQLQLQQQQQQQQQMELFNRNVSNESLSSGDQNIYSSTLLNFNNNLNHQSNSPSLSPSDALNLGINLEQYISKRNERERFRVRNVNDAFDHLKNSLPIDLEKLTKRVPKVEILRTAISYIKNLEQVLGYKHPHYNNQHYQHHQVVGLTQQSRHNHDQQNQQFHSNQINNYNPYFG